MPDNHNSYEEYMKRFRQSNEADEIIEGLDNLKAMQVSQNLSLTNRLEAQILAFKKLQNLFNDKPENADKVILEYLLPDCLLQDKHSSHLLSQHRQILRDWISSFDDVYMEIVRAKVLDKVKPLLETSDPKTACWVISSIGYRNQEIVHRLWKIINDNDGEIGDNALITLTWLGVIEKDRNNILSELHSRAAQRFNNSLLWGIARMGDQSSIQVIFENWLSSPAISNTSIDKSLVFSAVRDIVLPNEGDDHFQDKVWAETAKVVESNPETLYWAFDIGHIAKECNTPDVVPTLLTWHGHHQEWFENPDWARYLVQERLEKCIKPRQLKGWGQIKDQAIFEFVRKDACQDTKDDGFYTTQEQLTKQSAWKTLLCAGYQNSLKWFDDAVVGETSRFVRQKVMRYLACFRFDPLPDAVVDWIIEPYDDPGTGDGREMAFRIAATRVARSAATLTSFEHLINFGFTYKGKVLTQPSDAVADVAIALIRQGDTSVVESLINVLQSSGKDGQRLVCAHTLEVIASFPEFYQLLIPYADKIPALIYDENRDPIERGNLLNALGYLSSWEVPENMLVDIISWAYQPDKWIGGGSLHLLAHHNRLEENDSMMVDILKLDKDGGQWRMSSKDLPFDWAPYIIGVLYHNNPQAFVPVVVGILANLDWRPVVQIIRWLEITHSGPTSPSMPIEIIEALIQRTYKRYSISYSETEVFEILAHLAPQALVEHPWYDVVDNWMVDTRVALASALGWAQTKEENLAQCLATLEMLAEDSAFVVRRAAYRSLAKQSISHLYKLCQSWLESPILQLNLRAAEGFGWIEDSNSEWFSELYQECAVHPERTVREAAKRSWNDHRQRTWARGYLDKVMRVKGESNHEIFITWPYGAALGQIGEDECQEILRDHASQRPLPPNVRYWIGQILEEMAENWKKVTKEWPDPWVEMRGAIERGEGKLITDSEEIVIQYSTWHAPGTVPGERHSWGGTIVASFANFINIDTASIELQDQRRGRIIMRGFMGNTAAFLGTGPYPA